MTRIYLNLTTSQIEEAVDRNRLDKSELGLLLDELKRRKSAAARRVESKARLYLAQIVLQNPSQPKPHKLDPDVPPPPLNSSQPLPDRTDPTAAREREAKAMTDEQRWAQEAVASLRKKLIDLSKRNPLIAFKHGGRSTSHLRIVDERPDLLFQALDEGSMGFEPLPGEDNTPKDEQTSSFRIAYERARLTDEAFLAATEKLGNDEKDARAWQDAERALRARVREQLGLPPLDYGKGVDVIALAKAHGFDPSFDLKPSDDDDIPDHHNDDQIRVLLIRKELDKRLKSLWERYRAHARDTGLHTLFLVLGFVQWFEDESSDIALHAPLLLLAVDLDRQVVRGRYEYKLRGHDEGLQVNVALGELMRQRMGLELPELREDETPESYFVRVEEVLKKGNRLSLRRFATLAVLPFPRMVLWKDLDPSQWPEGAFAEHELLPGLLGAKEMGGAGSMAETFDIDAEPWAEKAPALIQPADASQHSALIDVVQGHSIAIEGPPGTGKSQTITNIIASALGAGKRVLFVAEKQAALSVVASRLKMMGFGPMLLELHGENANRADLYDSLRGRLGAVARSDEAALAVARQQLRRERDVLRNYLATIRTPVGALKRTAYWLAWREISLRNRVDRQALDYLALRWKPNDPTKLDRPTLAAHRSDIDNFGKALAEVDSDATNAGRTRWALSTRLGAFDQTQQLTAAAEAAGEANRIAESQGKIEHLLPLQFPPPDGATDDAAAQLERLSGFGKTPECIVLSALRNPDEARSLLGLQQRWSLLRAELEQDVSDASQLDADAIEKLTEAIQSIDAPPDTVGDCRERLASVSRQLEDEARTMDERNALLQLLDITDEIVVANLAEIAAVVQQLGDSPASVSALFGSDLLDPLTQVAAAQEQQSAQAHREERDELRQEANSSAFDLETQELLQLAKNLADSNVFERVFNGRFRGAKRIANSILNSYRGRESAADVLRRLARHKSRLSEFWSTSPAKQIFPALLWKGVDSDWDALAAAQAALKGGHGRLHAARSEQTLDIWLSLASSERTRACSLAKLLHPFLDRLMDLGFATCALSELREVLGRERDLLASLDDALRGANALSEGVLVRQGAHLGDRLSSLRSVQSDFDRIAAGQSFEWINGINNGLEELERALNHAGELIALPGPLDLGLALRTVETPRAALDAVIAIAPSYFSAEKSWKAAIARLEEASGQTPEMLIGEASDWESAATILEELARDELGARLAADLLRYKATLQEIGCGPLAAATLEGAARGDQLADLYELLVVRALLTAYLGDDGSILQRLGSLRLEAARREFVRIDKELHELEAKAIIAKAKQAGDLAIPRGVGHGPRGGWTEKSLVEHELSLRRPRTPIRDLTMRAGKTLQALKPVWMMSPTTAAQYIRPNTLQFDLLVVDEASQMRPEDAVSAILRGKQFIVVGDANQLPPTDFFTTGENLDEDDEDDSVTIDTESILDLANHRFERRRRLKWHYRSQHESLIQFSNRSFYDRDLVVFPSPTTEDDVLGVKCQYVGGTYEASINQKEAEAVIEEAFRLMRTYPQYSLGIVTMNAKQTELIRNEFDRLILEAPEVRKYVEEYAGGIDEFFIKSLENVQGDERDIMLISTVYGPSKEGTVAQRFGPMNREVGWRRLNVLVTRAKRSTRLFTSLRPNDIKITENSSRGLIAFQAYLTYAHNGAQFDDGSGGEPDSDFELFVADALRGAGYEVVYQVGVEGFRIDLGVRHADYPLGFIAGIECDGATYHSGLTVRDRDRIRQTILEGMGWNIYRIWSTDWFADPHRETAKLLAQLDKWRQVSAADYQSRASAVDEDEKAVETMGSASSSVVVQTPAPSAGAEAASEPLLSETDEPRTPHGMLMRALGDFDWYEVSKGRLYEIWFEDAFAGHVEVLSRATDAPRVYGGKAHIFLSEYEGWVQPTDEYFKQNDIYAAVREVARRAQVALKMNVARQPA